MRNSMCRIAMLVCVLIFLMTGCEITGSKINTGQGTIENNNLKDNDISWQASYSKLENQYIFALAADYLYGYYVKDDRILLDIIESKSGFYDPDSVTDKQNLFAKETLALSDASFLAGMAADQEGNIYLLGNKGETTGLWRIDTEGNLQDFAKMEFENTEKVHDLFLKGIYTDQNGTLFVWCEMTVPETKVFEGRENEVWHWEDRVYVKDRQLNTLFYEKIADMGGTDVLNFQIGTNGRPVFVVKDSEGVYTQEIDVAQKGRKDAVRLEKSGDSFDTDNISSVVSADNGFLYCMGDELYEFHFGTQKAEKLFSLSTYGILSSDILFLAKRGDEIVIIDNHGDAKHSELISFTLGKSDKKTLALGMVMAAQDLEEAVSEFNRYSNEYRVELVDYFNQTRDYDKAIEQLKLDVVTGKAPDIIAVSGIDYSMFSEKGVLADLYGFMRDDEEFSKDMLVRSVVEAYEDGGHLYNIAPAFHLHSMWGYGDVAGGHSGVTFEELFQILEDSGKDLNAIAGFSADEPVLTRLCTVAMDEFVDWENGTCDFAGDYFKKVLAFAKEYTGNYTGGTYLERIHNREVVMSVGIISSVVDYQIAKELYGGAVAFIGYPVAEGTGTAITFRGSDVAINAKKENQDGAWEFVKFYLLHGYDGQGFPIVQRQFSQILDASMEEEYNITEDGGTERKPKECYTVGDERIWVYAATQEDVDTVRWLVESAENRFEPHPVIQNIINEEAEAYFSGQMNLDKTVEKIQNRVTLLLQESL